MDEDRGYRLVMENADIIPNFRNFAGRESQFNKPGVRNFCVNIDPETANRLLEDGWSSIKFHKDPETGERDLEAPYMRIRVRFDMFPPTIFTVSNGVKTRITEDMVEMLDWADIRNVDVIVTGSVWHYTDKTGIKPYLKTMYVIIEEDELAKKYADDE